MAHVVSRAHLVTALPKRHQSHVGYRIRHCISAVSHSAVWHNHFGSYLATVHGVQQLAAEAARSSVAGLSDTEGASLAQSYVTQNVQYYPLILPNRVSVSAAAAAGNPNVFVVTVSYDDSTSFIYFLPQPIKSWDRCLEPCRSRP
jgi:hypothetical protein